VTIFRPILILGMALLAFWEGKIIFRPPKTAKERRTIALLPSAVLLLKEHWEKQKLDRAMLGIPLSDDDLVFSHFDGVRYCPIL